MQFHLVGNSVAKPFDLDFIIDNGHDPHPFSRVACNEAECWKCAFDIAASGDQAMVPKRRTGTDRSTRSNETVGADSHGANIS